MRKLRVPTALPFAVLAILLSAGACTCDTDDSGDGGTPDGAVDGGTDGGTDDGGTDGGGTDGGGTDGGGTDGGGGLTDVTCPGTLPDPGAERCVVTPGNETLLLLSGTVLAADGIYRGGSVLVARGTGRILCTGCDCGTDPAASGATEIACANSVISPGLINAHDHSTYNLSYPQPHGTERYDHRHEWRRGLDGHTELNVSPGSSSARDDVLYGELRQVFAGGTSIVGSTSNASAAGVLRNLDQASQTDGLSGVDVNYDTFPLGDANGTMLDGTCSYPNIASLTDVTNHPVYFPHVSEGINGEAENEFICISSSAGTDLLESNTTIVHGIGLTAVDVAEMSAAGASLVWSPRSNISLYGHTAPVTMYDTMGVLVAIGSDWSASGSMNILRELQCADEFNSANLGGYFDDRELWNMATWTAAAVMGAGDQIGSISDGYFADISVFEASGASDYRAVLEAEIDDVVFVLKGAEPLYGDDALVSAWVPSAEASQCETLDVCGRSRGLCLQRDAGLTMADLDSSVTTAAYPLYFCGAAASDPIVDEPTCVPSRPSEFDGVPGGSDLDGDGIDDGNDLCPAIFSAPKPMDAMAQADTDSDGIGDFCDLCPLTAGETCTPIDPNDIDGDGYDNPIDVCPRIPDDQTDSDGDGMGDVCDICPNDPNPAGAGCPSTVQLVQGGTIADGTPVVLSGLTVTAVAPRGFFAQDASAASPEYSAIYVYENAAPTVVLGDIVSVDGTFIEYYELTEISSPTVTVTGSGAVPAPTLLTVAEIRTGGTLMEAYESVLVEVQSTTITHLNPDGASDYNEFEVGGTASTVDTGLRVDDMIFDYNTDAVTTDPDFRTLGRPFSSLVGPLMYSFSNSKILPRDAADMAP